MSFTCGRLTKRIVSSCGILFLLVYLVVVFGITHPYAQAQSCCILKDACWLATDSISTKDGCKNNGGVWVSNCNSNPECQLGCCILNNVNGTECIKDRTKTSCQTIEGSIWDESCSNSLCQGDASAPNCCILEDGGCQPVNNSSECASPNVFQEGKCSTNILCRVGCCVNQKAIGVCAVSTQGECVVKGGGINTTSSTWKWYDNNCEELGECTFYTDVKEKPPLEFIPSVTIPGMIKLGGKTFSINKGEGIVVDGLLLAKYIAVVFQWLLGAVGVVAVAFVAYGGLLWLTAFGNPEAINKARKTIIDSLVGVVLVVASYVLLNQVNSKLVVFKPLQIEPVIGIPLESEEDIEAQPPPNLVKVQGDNIIVDSSKNHEVDREIMLDLLQVAKALKKEGYSLVFASGYRSPKRQKELVVENCQNPNDDKRCIPKSGKPVTCKMLKGTTSCPHTSGRAVDIWGGKGNSQCIYQDECRKDINACRKNKCQAALIREMRELGYCILASEPWHFEKPKMSSSCQ